MAQSTLPAPLPRQGNRQALSAVRMVAACAAASGSSAWIALSVETVPQWQAPAALVGLATPAAGGITELKAQEPMLEAAVRRWAAARDADSAVAPPSRCNPAATRSTRATAS